MPDCFPRLASSTRKGEKATKKYFMPFTVQNPIKYFGQSKRYYLHLSMHTYTKTPYAQF